MQIEASANEIEQIWSKMEFTVTPYQSKGIGGQQLSTAKHYILKGTDDVYTQLEDSTLKISALKGSKFAKAFEYKLDCWENLLNQI